RRVASRLWNGHSAFPRRDATARFERQPDRDPRLRAVAQLAAPSDRHGRSGTREPVVHSGAAAPHAHARRPGEWPRHSVERADRAVRWVFLTLPVTFRGDRGIHVRHMRCLSAALIALLLITGPVHAQKTLERIQEAAFLTIGGIEQGVTIR